MNREILKIGVLAFLGIGTLSHAQEGNVGVNTTSPAATLEVVGKASEATKADGIIAPRLTGDELAAKNNAYTATHTGALVYVTSAAATQNLNGKTQNVNAAGYYYFDGNVWVKTSAGASVTIPSEPWRVLGTNAEATSNTQRIYQDARVGIGTFTSDNSNSFRGLFNLKGTGELLTFLRSTENGTAYQEYRQPNGTQTGYIGYGSSANRNAIQIVNRNLTDGIIQLGASRVAINNESNVSPRATLDVMGSPATTTVADGIIAPKLTGNQLFAKDAAYGTTQEGALVYVTAAADTANRTGKTANVDAVGYYYFDGTAWIKAKGGVSENIYTANSTLTSARTATLGTNDLTFDGTGNGKVRIIRNGGNLAIAGNGGSGSHAYMEIFKNGVSSTRTAYIGHEGGSDNNLTLKNEISNGSISLRNNTIIEGTATITNMPQVSGSDYRILVNNGNVVSQGITIKDIQKSQVEVFPLTSIDDMTIGAGTHSNLLRGPLNITLQPGDKYLVTLAIGFINRQPSNRTGSIFPRFRFLETSEAANREVIDNLDTKSAEQYRFGPLYISQGFGYNMVNGMITGSIGIKNPTTTPKTFYLYVDFASSGNLDEQNPEVPEVELKFKNWSESYILLTPVAE